MLKHEGSAKETPSSPHKDARRLIYDRNDRTDARKLRVVSHNLGIRSPSTSRSAIVMSVVSRYRWRLFIKQCVRDEVESPGNCILKRAPEQFRPRIHTSLPVDISTMRELSLYLPPHCSYYYCKACVNPYRRSRRNWIRSYWFWYICIVI